MEENTAVSSGDKRRNSIPSAVILPTSLHNGGHHNHHHHYFYQHHRSHQSTPSPSPASLAVSDFELVSFKSPDDSYTSLKDLIPTSSTSGASILSPPPHNATTAVTSAISNASSGGSGYEISIRNRLVKQAAWAYLQPTMASSPSSSRRCFFFSGEFLRPLFADFRRVVVEWVTRGYDWLVDALWLILCR